jgi:hypothetical protein
MRRPDSELWYQAMVREMEAHLENGTWELVKLPPGRKAIGSKCDAYSVRRVWSCRRRGENKRRWHNM